jgi:hypothetical protein
VGEIAKLIDGQLVISFSKRNFVGRLSMRPGPVRRRRLCVQVLRVETRPVQTPVVHVVPVRYRPFKNLVRHAMHESLLAAHLDLAVTVLVSTAGPFPARRCKIFWHNRADDRTIEQPNDLARPRTEA